MLLLKYFFPSVRLDVQSLGNNKSQPCSGCIYDKNVSLSLGSIVYVVCFVFDKLLSLLFARKMFSVNLNYLNKR